MWKKLLLLLLIAVVALVAYLQLRTEPPVRITTVSASTGTLTRKLDITGSVINNQTVTITALLDGEIIDIKARKGDSVAAGDTLAILDSQQVETLLNKANAELDYAKQNQQTAARTYTRQRNLSRAGNASKQALDDSLDALRSAESSVKVAQATVELHELQLQNATIVAPFAGTVTQQAAETGQWVEAGTPLFTLVADDGYVIEARIDASDWRQVSTGQEVILSTDTNPDEQWQSKVDWIAPSITRDNRDGATVALRFPFGDSAPPLLLGQELNAELTLASVEEALILPLQAMREHSPGEYTVFVFRDGKALKQSVKVGLQNTSDAQIVDGLGSGEEVILLQNVRLYDGMSVAR